MSNKRKTMKDSDSNGIEEEEEETMKVEEDISADDEYSSSDYSSSDGGADDLGYGNLLQHALFPPAGTGFPPADTRTPLERWRDYLTDIRIGKTRILKLTDMQFEQELQALPALSRSEEDQNNSASWIADLVTAVTAASMDEGILTHAMIGPKLLTLLGKEQKRLFSAVASHQTLSFFLVKGCNNSCSDEQTALEMDAVVEALGDHSTPALSEMELEGIKFTSLESIQQWSHVLVGKRDTLRQINMIGITTLSKNGALQTGWLDPIILALAPPSADVTTPLDELKLMGIGDDDNGAISQKPTITAGALKTLLQYKKKWWRLGLDGLGLHDEHIRVLTTMFCRDESCKAGDLLSLLGNPAITAKAYQEFFEGCFFWKRRMGLIKVDDKEWEAQFDLVRSMNNLHNRLDYVVSKRHSPSMEDTGFNTLKAGFGSRDKWVEWLVKLGTGLPWEDDKHRLNYLWFTLLEKPDFIYSHVNKWV